MPFYKERVIKMADAKTLVEEAIKQGYSREQVIQRMKQRGSTQRDIDRVEMAFADKGAKGLVGKVRDVGLAAPRFLFPQTTKVAEESLYGFGANVRDLATGDRGAVQARAQEAPKPGIGAAIPPANLLGGGDVGGSTRELGISAILQLIGGKVSEKVLPPILKRVGLGLPKTVQSNIQVTRKIVGQEIDDILKPLYEEAVDERIIPETVSKLATLLERPEISVSKEAQAAIKGIIKEVSGVKNIKQLAGTATKFGQEIYGEAGKELTKRGTPGIAEKTGKQIAGDILTEGLEYQVPSVTGPRADYQALSKLGVQMANPYKNWWMGGLAGTLLSPSGVGVAGPVGVGTTLGAMPYSRFALQKLLGPAISAGRYPAMGAINQLLNFGNR